MTERRAGLEPIGESLDAFLGRIGMPPAMDLGALADAWPEMAGEAVAGVSTPVGFDDGVLAIGVADGASASLLKYRIGGLLDRLQERFGADMVTAIRIRVVPDKKGL